MSLYYSNSLLSSFLRMRPVISHGPCHISRSTYLHSDCSELDSPTLRRQAKLPCVCPRLGGCLVSPTFPQCSSLTLPTNTEAAVTIPVLAAPSFHATTTTTSTMSAYLPQLTHWHYESPD
jgi:hypothetical protein